MKEVALFVKTEIEAQKQADRFENWLCDKIDGVVRICNNECKENLSTELTQNILCMFVLGGDGTFLSAVRWMQKKQVPIIGVKFGEVGFLSETTEQNLYAVAGLILEKGFVTQPKMRLEVKVIRNKRTFFEESVLNDIVINKSALARLAQIETYVDSRFVTEYRADGLIIATPTGSTAYSLAAGGPIIYPSLNGILITPICPFTLTNRPLILPEGVEVIVKLADNSSDIMLTFDGQIGVKIDKRDKVIIKKSEHPVNMITLPDQDYFDVLKAKLRWSGSRI